jgi:hypothetical protein
MRPPCGRRWGESGVDSASLHLHLKLGARLGGRSRAPDTNIRSARTMPTLLTTAAAPTARNPIRSLALGPTVAFVD